MQVLSALPIWVQAGLKIQFISLGIQIFSAATPPEDVGGCAAALQPVIILNAIAHLVQVCRTSGLSYIGLRSSISDYIPVYPGIFLMSR